MQQLLGESDFADTDELISRLIDRHGTGRVLFRNTRHAIKGFPGREVQGYALPLPADYRKHRADITPETNYPRKWPKVDPRVEWLVGKLRELAPEKVLVICAHAKTVVGLREYLFEKEGMHLAMFHEGMQMSRAMPMHSHACVFPPDRSGLPMASSAASPSAATLTAYPARDRKGANRFMMAVSSSTKRSLGLLAITYSSVFLKTLLGRRSTGKNLYLSNLNPAKPYFTIIRDQTI